MASKIDGRPIGGNEPSFWSLEDSELYADCRIFKTFRQTFSHPDGRSGKFFVNSSNDWVQTAPLFVDSSSGLLSTLLVGQFRFGVRKISWEFSGGIVETGESPVAAACRELLEETGFGGGEAKLVASYWPNPAIQDNSSHFVTVENCKKTAETSWDKNEEMKIIQVPVSQIDSMIKNGDICHSLSICSAYFLRDYLLKYGK